MKTEDVARKLRDMIRVRQLRKLKYERVGERWRVLDEKDFGHFFDTRREARDFLRAYKKGGPRDTTQGAA